MTKTLLPTTVVGSYPQPDWLIDRDKLTHLPPVRIRAQELWRGAQTPRATPPDDVTPPSLHAIGGARIHLINHRRVPRARDSSLLSTAHTRDALHNPARKQEP